MSGSGVGATLATWTGGFAEREVGIRVRTDDRRSLVPVELLVGVALRRNPRRAQLLVSTVLAKHVPTDPGLAIVAAQLLGLLVGGELDGNRPPGGLFARLARILQQMEEAGGGAASASAPASGSASASAGLAALRAEVAELRSKHPEVVTIGYAETATGLGQFVAETIGSFYIHSTRHAPAGRAPFAGFEEEHSHATSHQLYPDRTDWLRPGGTVVLVDDELSTGTTIVNTIRALHQVAPQSRWVVASLIDLRSDVDRARFDTLAEALGTSIAVVALGSGTVDLPPDVLARAARALPPAAPALPADALALPRAAPVSPRSQRAQGASKGPELLQSAPERAVSVLSMAESGVESREAEKAGSREAGAGAGALTLVEVAGGGDRSARFGVDARPGGLDGAAARIVAALDPVLPGGATLVLGSEEYIALPLAVADELAHGHRRTGGQRSVRFSTTTRSPIAAIDRPDYAIASALGFQSHDLTSDGFGPRFAYNLTRSGCRFDAIVFVPEPDADRDRMLAADGVAEALRRVTDHVFVVLTHPEEPATP
ncbi:hypothetical protein B7R54_01110 [Subtercola boreus]|uniref:Phosphoribosyltransferase domain-containing protein n=1 Tax=Subtercola boreus TaxID=120213 RepID=A0A3E0VET1_9MICO|nr:phosphoribosyltransferase domain-containing protein [Subtercola boreus]RFA07968.1 hypothetical protein B7R54_01110 [Subtercola boreus]TQL55167.1 phosphoribosyltransferase-like predicted ribonucleoside biosynthesis protein [Subtercola boreus]